MGQQIIRQPDGRLAVFSSITESFIVTDATSEEIIEWRAEEAAETARERTKVELKRVLDDTLGSPYHQFMLTWEEASRRGQEGGDSDA